MGYLFDIAIFILVLGELVFFHELGHFLAAKACGIYCERFSLGMPPRLFGFKFGETDYCVGLLPIGGYVKMAGQEDVPLSEDERKEQYGSIPPNRWFMNKPVWQRVIVITAGPFMNIVLAVLIYAILVGFGAEMPESKHDNRIGYIEPDSPAATAPLYKISPDNKMADLSTEPDATGWKTGDRIVSIEGRPVENIMDVQIENVLSGGETVIAEIERTHDDGSVARYISPVQPRKIDDSEHVRVGITPFETALVDVVIDGMPAQAAGIKHGDIVTRLNGKPVDKGTFREAISGIREGESVVLELIRDGQPTTVSVTPMLLGNFKDILIGPNLDWIDTLDVSKPLKVREEDPKLLEGTGFLNGDAVVSVNGESITRDLVRRLSERPGDEKLQVVVERQGLLGFGERKQVSLPDVTVGAFLQAITPFDVAAKPRVLGITAKKSAETGIEEKDIIEEVEGQPATIALLKELRDSRIGETISVTVRKPPIGYGMMRSESTRETKLEVTAAGMVGIQWGEKTTFYRAPLARVFPEAFRETWRMIKLTVRTLESLVSQKISPRELGGPMMIYQATTNAARFGGYVGLMETTAFISVNLAIFNLLPLPVLDGGHLLFLTIESVRRKPVSARVMEWVQQAGLVLIVGLMLFVTFNDIRRWFENLLP